MSTRFHDLHVAGCTRRLPILNLPDAPLAIAAFVILGDVELTVNCARELIKKLPDKPAILMTAETKGIPLVAEMARQMGQASYIVARKSVKAYMENPLWVEDESITTQGKQRLYLSDDDIKRIKGHDVILVDDVISTGGSLKAMASLVEKAGGKIIGQAAVLAEGDAAKREDIIYLQTLPLFDPE